MHDLLREILFFGKRSIAFAKKRLPIWKQCVRLIKKVHKNRKEELHEHTGI